LFLIKRNQEQKLEKKAQQKLCEENPNSSIRANYVIFKEIKKLIYISINRISHKHHMAITDSDIIFHLLDLQARDIRIESTSDEVKEVVYESNSDDSDDDEIIKASRKKKGGNPGWKPREFVIHLFGSTETGKPIRCDVSGFRPTFYIRLPEERTSAAIDTITQYINSQGIPLSQIKFKRVSKKIFYGFTANTFYPFLQIDVPSLAIFRNLRGLFLDEYLNYATKKPILGGKPLEIYEANIDPLLRFIHIQNIQPCGWVVIKGGKSSITEESDAGIIIECDFEDVLPTKGPRVSAPFLTASWDIECFSMTGDFPLAKRTWHKTAKEIFRCAKTGMQAVDLVLAHLTYKDSVMPPKLILTPIHCTLKKNIDLVRKKFTDPSIMEEIQSLLVQDELDDEDIIIGLEKFFEKTTKSLIHLTGDPVIQIGTTLTRGSAETTTRHLFVFPDCDPIPGIEVHAFPTEKEMCGAWFEWICRMNPDILIGYNVFGFDESYLWQRCEELGLLGANSAIHNFTRLVELGSEMKLEEKFLSSSAMGDNRMYIWTTHGRLQIDMFHYIKRNNVLPSYKLDEVTKHFMSGKLKRQSYDGENKVLMLDVAGAVKDVRVGRSIMLLDETGETVSEKLVVDSVDGSKIYFHCELDMDQLMELEDATKWVIVKDDVSPQDIFRLHRESSAGRAIVGKYCLQDCDLVIELYRKLEVFNNSMSMANVCSVPVSYIFIRGQGIKIESLIFKECGARNILIPVLTVPSQGARADDSYEGAIVLDPEPGFYATSPVGVCDFASLYPSTIVSENISHDSLLWIKDFHDDGRLIAHRWGSEVYDECEGYAYTDIEFDIIRPDPKDERKHPSKIKCGRRICRYAQPLDGSKSTLPQITTWLLTARSAKKKEMKAEKDPERYALLDAEQLAYKLTGNSLYGQLGSGTFKIRLQALAASVTAYGRKQILFAKDAIDRFYGPGRNLKNCSAKTVYGDTDSLFVEFNPRNPETGQRLEGREARQATIDITDEAGHFITKVLAAPHDFEFDKCFDPLLMFSKKRYAGNMYEENADNYVHKYMGIALKRRDNAPIVKTIFGGAMKMLLDKRDVIGSFQFVKDKCLELVDGKVSLGQLMVTKSLRADYADPTRIAHKALADRIFQRDPGNAPAAGDRIGYVYISPVAGQQASKLQGERIETPQFIKEHALVPDYRHYIEHQLQNPISQAFALLLEQIPGFHPDMVRGCPANSNLDKYLAFREGKAAELLFSDCLRRFESASKRNAMRHMFGAGAVIVSRGQTGVAKVIEKPVKKTVIQTSISSYLLDSFIVDNLKKKDQAKQKKEQAKQKKEEEKS
jgi:DNA polymerase elongation subunit (family B)